MLISKIKRFISKKDTNIVLDIEQKQQNLHCSQNNGYR